MVTLTKHAEIRIYERFNNDPSFKEKFIWALKMVKRGKTTEYNHKDSTSHVVYDGVKYIYQKVGNKRILITTY